jgi:hypothetical protein
MEDHIHVEKPDLESDLGTFPGIPRTVAMGLALAGAVGSLYFFAATYQAGKVPFVYNSSVPTATAGLVEIVPPRRDL